MDAMNMRQVTIDRRLRERGDSLPAFLARERDTGTSWQMLSHALRDATGDYVAHETLRRWYDALCAPKAAA